MRNNNILIVLIVVIALFVIGGGAFLFFGDEDDNNNTGDQGNVQDQDDDETDDTSTPTDSDENPNAEIDFTINMEDFSFSPRVIEAKAGETINVKIVGLEGAHDFTIDELDVKSATLTDGDSDTVQINIPANAAGKTFEFYCSIMNHKQMGMTGQIKVSSN